MSDPQNKSNLYTTIFIVVLCSSCAFILSFLSIYLQKPQEQAKELYRSKELLVAAHILNYKGEFIIEKNGTQIPAVLDIKTDQLIPWEESSPPPKAKDREILKIYEMQVKPMLTNNKGELFSFDRAGIEMSEYISDNQKYGFSKLPFKLVYVIEKGGSPYAYVIPVNGYGLWDAIYGYIAIAPDGNRVLGITWYDQKETPGLGGEIALPEFQSEFVGKHIFRENADGQTNFDSAIIGIRVVKTTVKDELGNSPALSAVDGISGATITSSGVTEALRNSLTPYRNFLIEVHNRNQK